MDQTSASISKTKRINPLIYTHLVTSTPDSYQVTKRIKWLFGYSEHYKGNSDQGFCSLRSREYRKARELILELWNPAQKNGFLEKFLKSQKNIEKVTIRIIKENCSEERLEQLLKALCKMSWLNRLHIDFEKRQGQRTSFLIHQLQYLKFFLKLKDWTITVDGEELFPFSASLFQIGFGCESSPLVVKSEPVIEQLMKKTPKFHQLDTLRVDSKKLGSLPNKFLDRLAFVIPRLPNFKELNLNYSRGLYLSPKPALNLFDILIKAQKFEILRMGTQMKDASQILILKHPLFMAKSLKRTHISLFFYKGISIENLNQILELLQGIPSLYKLYLDFSYFPSENDETAENLMKKLSLITSLRKLKIVFGFHAKKLNERQAGRIIRWIFNGMPFLEELVLYLPKNGLDLGERNGEDIQGLPRLTKAFISLKECDVRMEKSVWGLIEILGKCHRLRELEMDLTGSVYDYVGMTKKFGENLAKLKRLQVFKLQARSKEISVSLVKKFFATFEKMRDLQDWSFGLMLNIKNSEDREELQTAFNEMESKKKYRFFDFGSRQGNSLSWNSEF